MANIVRNFGWIENRNGERKDVNVKLKVDRKDLGVRAKTALIFFPPSQISPNSMLLYQRNYQPVDI